MEMPAIVKRPYHSPLRRAQADATRARILDAALVLFSETGYAATTIAAVARKAGVVPETIYASFGTKKALIDGLIDRAAPPEMASTLETRWVAEAGDPPSQLGVIAGFAADFWANNDALVRVLRQGSGDAEIGAEWTNRQEARRVLFGRALAGWPAGVRKPGLGRERAADLVWALTSDELFHLLVIDRGWPVEAYRTWLASALRSAVLR
jgi:AcrR family transcriptional regulator